MKKWTMNGALFVIALVAAFVLIEGLSSLAILGFDIVFRPNPGLNSRKHVQHDERLGWVNTPNYHSPDHYGPGASLTINSQSFRNQTNFSDAVPPGKARVLCSGDSFTLGFGVGDSHTWCHLLTTLDPRFETVNLGEAGYGVGQAFLKYERHAATLDHDVHIFAFVNDDLRRLGLSKFVAWPKPLVTIRDGVIGVDNVPIPRRSFFLPWYTYNRGRFDALRTIQLGQRLLQRLTPARSDASVLEEEARIRRVAIRLFERIQELNSGKGSVAVFVFLATNIPEGDLERDRIRFFGTELEARGLQLFDLATEFRRLPYNELQTLFDPKWKHYSVRGNEFAARHLYERLMSDPEIRGRLAEAAGTKPRAEGRSEVSAIDQH